MGKKNTETVRIWGIVQGVGFRPFVAKLAEKMGMAGEVSNEGGQVLIKISDNKKRIDRFIEKILAEKPPNSEIVHMERNQVQFAKYDGFKIVGSGQGDEAAGMIPADIAICDRCLADMAEHGNPRYDHPFISCTACGPRFSIVKKFPYDRENTSMDQYEMCDFCRGEYEDLNNTRFHAQTISCNQCGPMVELEKIDQVDFNKDPLDMCASVLKEGRIIAFKSVGGYNLMCDPFDLDVVKKLRKIKGRDSKPFAIMFKDVEQVEMYCNVSKVERSLLTSTARPIVLMERKTLEELDSIRPGNYGELEKSRFIGGFLPGMAAQYLVLEKYGQPLIATSANLSGLPIITDDEEMKQMCSDYPDIVEMVYNRRKIINGVDDSVVRVIDGKPQMIRRSKGYVPRPIFIEEGKGEMIAVGGHLKNTFCITKEGFYYPGRYIGDMETVEQEEIFEKSLKDMMELFRVKPGKVVCDMHPNYFTTKFARQYAEENGVELIQVQHHHSHVASVMAEHNLKDKVIGVSFDGTGYGDDGRIWGGEVLICEGAGYERFAHLKYVKMIGGDQSVKEGWKSALSYIYGHENIEKEAGYDRDGEGSDVREFQIDVDEIIEYSKEQGTLDHREVELAERVLENSINTVESSSMGRLFDAVSAMLGICDYSGYEGQCAIMLEDAAHAGKDVLDGIERMAYDFHIRVVEKIVENCVSARRERGVNQVALTGGVFQNRILMEESLRRLKDMGFEVYYNTSVSPGDGGLSLGQAYIGGMMNAE